MTGALLSAAVLIVGGLVAFTLAKHSATATSREGGGGPQATTDTAGSESAIRDHAAGWVAGQVSRAAVVSCDPAMCRLLMARGFPAGDLHALTPGTASPLGSDLIVATPAIRDQFGSRLSSTYSPAVIASFGSGDLRIDIRAIAPHGPSAFRAALQADVRARKASGAQLLDSNRITVSDTARGQLSVGQVDSRLLITIAGMAALHPVYIVAFGDSGPGAGPGSPLRSVDLSQGASRGESPANVRSLVAFLRAQNAPYHPARTEQVRLAGGLTVLRVEFAAPSPLGLLNPNA